MDLKLLILGVTLLSFVLCTVSQPVNEEDEITNGFKKAQQEFVDKMPPIIDRLKANNPNRTVGIQTMYDSLFISKSIIHFIDQAKRSVDNMSEFKLRMNKMPVVYNEEMMNNMEIVQMILIDSAYVEAVRSFFNDQSVKLSINRFMNDTSVKNKLNDYMTNPEKMKNITEFLKIMTEKKYLSKIIATYYDQIDNLLKTYWDDVVKNSSDSDLKVHYQEMKSFFSQQIK